MTQIPDTMRRGEERERWRLPPLTDLRERKKIVMKGVFQDLPPSCLSEEEEEEGEGEEGEVLKIVVLLLLLLLLLPPPGIK